MFALVTLMTLVNQVSGTPYISGGDTARGTDCSGLASWVANVASGRPAFGDRFNTGNQERALLARGFKYGTAPNAVVIGWNGGHTAVTLPDGTPVSSGEGGGVKVGGGGAYQPQFTKHMYLPMDQVDPAALPPAEPEAPAPDFAPTDPAVVPVDVMLPPPVPEPAPNEQPVILAAAELPAPVAQDPMLAPPIDAPPFDAQVDVAPMGPEIIPADVALPTPPDAPIGI